jgi:hypothetical protein
MNFFGPAPIQRTIADRPSQYGFVPREGHFGIGETRPGVYIAGTNLDVIANNLCLGSVLSIGSARERSGNDKT